MSSSSEQRVQQGELLLGKYRVDAVLGRGGMGLVVKAHHLGLDEEVAIKLLRDDVPIDDETKQRFVQEAQSAAKLKSEHVCRITDVGTFPDGKPYMVMEFLEGSDIGQMITDSGPLHPSLAIDLVLQACDALAEAHAYGIIHRDVKPANLFVTFRPDGSALLKVLDFGISKATAGQDLSLTQTSSMLGTPAYMSPEQMRSARRVDARTDIWSLGSVLYEAIEGHLPFSAETFSEMCVTVAVDPPTPMVRTPPELQRIILRCLAKAPDQRYPSMADLAADLGQYARDPHHTKLMVDRMFRMNQRSHTNTAFGGGSSPGVQPYRGAVATGPISIAQPPKRSGRRWLVVPFVLVAVIAGAIVTSLIVGGETPAVATGSGSAIGSGSGSGSAIAGTSGSGSGSGSGSTAAAAAAAAAAQEAAAGSGSAIVVATPPPSHPPRGSVRPAGKGSATAIAPPATGSATVKQPPVTPCDPFTSRTACK